MILAALDVSILGTLGSPISSLVNSTAGPVLEFTLVTPYLSTPADIVCCTLKGDHAILSSLVPSNATSKGTKGAVHSLASDSRSSVSRITVLSTVIVIGVSPINSPPINPSPIVKGWST